ncbi:hypothetical protein B0H13DRAFT_1861619 [Mycena leptocephala]|nr:hypothetical protein B0H13DRAFT_1861619 [Mycena leptocephala]
MLLHKILFPTAILLLVWLSLRPDNLPFKQGTDGLIVTALGCSPSERCSAKTIGLEIRIHGCSPRCTEAFGLEMKNCAEQCSAETFEIGIQGFSPALECCSMEMTFGPDIETILCSPAQPSLQRLRRFLPNLSQVQAIADDVMRRARILWYSSCID